MVERLKTRPRPAPCRPAMAGRFAFLVAAAIVLYWLAAPAAAAEPGSLPLRPGELFPQPRQRGLDEIDSLPTRDAPCPVCDFTVAIPLADPLMRRPAGYDGPPLKWRMDAASRDADLCPYPGPGKIAFQADLVSCPSCGYTRKADHFPEPVPTEAKAWVLANLLPAMREAQINLLGRRGPEMSEAEILDFFNSQSEIPDTVRTELFHTYLNAVHARPAQLADICVQAAWAARREAARPPRARIFARHVAVIEDELAAAGAGVHQQADALRAMLRKWGHNRQGLPGANDMAARMLLVGRWCRLGFLDEAEAILLGLYQECRERFLRPEQDPLWSATTARASHSQRKVELEALRSEAEREILVRTEMVRRERDIIFEASEHIRQALGDGALDKQPEEALFQAYLVGEFLRRGGRLPLAAEWFKNLASLAGPDTSLGLAAQEQLGCLGEEAGSRVNLLSALGQDGELFARLRRICGGLRRSGEGDLPETVAP